MLSDEISAIIIQLYDISGNDHNCSFYRRGKKATLEKVMKSPEARNLLHECGDTIPITKNVLKKLKKFVPKFVYGSKKSTCAEARADQWKSMKNKTSKQWTPGSQVYLSKN